MPNEPLDKKLSTLDFVEHISGISGGLEIYMIPIVIMLISYALSPEQYSKLLNWFDPARQSATKRIWASIAGILLILAMIPLPTRAVWEPARELYWQATVAKTEARVKENLKPNQRYGWVWNGAWLQDEEGIVLNDWPDRPPILIPEKSKFRISLSPACQVCTIKNTAAGYVISEDQSLFSLLDKGWQEKASTSLRPLLEGESGPLEPRAGTIRDWAYSQGTFIGLGDFCSVATPTLSSAPRCISGLFTWNLWGGHPSVLLHHPIALSDPIAQLFTLGLQYTAATEDGVYALFPGEEDHFSLIEILPRESPVEYNNFPVRAGVNEHALDLGELETWPDLKHGSNSSDGIQGRIDNLRQIEKSSLIAGLYSDRSRLFLLIRKAHLADGEAESFDWSLYRLSANLSRIDKIIALPVSDSAAHLVVIPGSKGWAVLEKGRVERNSLEGEPPLRQELLDIKILEI